MNKLSKKQEEAYQAYLDRCTVIKESTKIYVRDETDAEKTKRINSLKVNFPEFAKYYFPHLMDSDFAYFHLDAVKAVMKDKNFFGVLEWPREHAKSVFTDIMLLMYMYVNGEVSGVVLVSSNSEKATGLLSEVQAEFTSNSLFVNDFGNLAMYGDWAKGKFALKDNTGFWGFGRKQPPRGIRKVAKRPNLCIIDDIDDSEIVQNPKRVERVVEWLLGDLFFALPIKGCRTIFIGNRFHKNCTLSYIVGDVEDGDPKNDNVTYHSKVYALENPVTHEMDLDGQPAWKERYTKAEILKKMKTATHGPAMREFFHQHILEGSTFKSEWFQYTNPLKSKYYENIALYCDPSYKNTAQSDFKAIVVVGKISALAVSKFDTPMKAGDLHVLGAWIERSTPLQMIRKMFDYFEIFGHDATYSVEANMLQDLIGKDLYAQEAERRGYTLPYRQDKQRKDNKVNRIENMAAIFELNKIWFAETERKSKGMQRLIDQLKKFPTGEDDGPDALQGAIEKLERGNRSRKTTSRSGTYSKNPSRR